jgi:PTS system mannitol-specific IIA component
MARSARSHDGAPLEETGLATEGATLVGLLAEHSIVLDAQASSRDDAIRQVGAILIQAGAIEPEYVESMIARENSVSTYVGESVAVPHGLLSGRDAVLRDAIAVVRFPDGVDWNGNDVRVVVGIAAHANGHIGLLLELATVLLDPMKAAALRAATRAEQVYDVLAPSAAD